MMDSGVHQLLSSVDKRVKVTSFRADGNVGKRYNNTGKPWARNGP